VIEHVRGLVDGAIVWAPGLMGAAVVSPRGGDSSSWSSRDIVSSWHTVSSNESHQKEQRLL
jgi:uncharacterized linocin/CFP29 family protein